MSRPDFDPTVYESAELAEINRPVHGPAWDLIEAQAAYRALGARDAGVAEAHDRVMVALAAHRAACAVADELERAYLATRPEPTEDDGDAADQLTIAL